MKFVDKVAFYSSPMGKMRLLLHLPNLIKLYARLFTDKRVSWLPKLVLVGGLAYFVMPLDAIPDFPLLGFNQLDDLAVLLFAVRAFVALSPRHVVEEHVRLIDEGV